MPSDQDQSQKSDDASAINRATSEFITVIAHKIHTPVAAIKWQVETLLDENMGSLSTNQRDLLQGVMDAANNLNDLSRSLLYVFELEKDLPMLKPQDVDLYQLIERAKMNLAKLITDHKTEISLERGERSAMAYIDPELGFMIIRTLLENAVCYSEHGKPVTVTVTQDDEGTHVCVRDQGCGIPGDLEHLVFTKFFRTHKAKQMHTDGAGLNLSIAHSIAKRTGGDLTFESIEGKGSTFCWFIPRKKEMPQQWG